METNRIIEDRLDEIFFEVIDYVDEYEVNAFIELFTKIIRRPTTRGIRRKYKKLVDKVGRDMRTKCIITTEDYEMYGDDVDIMVMDAIDSLLWDEVAFGRDSQQAFQMMKIAGIFD